MKADEYDCEVNQGMNYFGKGWEICERLLRKQSA